VPVRAIVAVAPFVALLLIVTVPVAAPAAAGSNATFSAADCPEFSVSGVVRPDIEKPVPAIAALLIVTAPLPLAVSVTVCVEGVFSATLPNATLVLPSVSPAVPAVVPAFSSSTEVIEVFQSAAVSVTVCAVFTAATVAVNATLVPPGATVTDDGIVTAPLLLLSDTQSPAELAALFSATVQTSVPAPASEALLQVSELS